MTTTIHELLPELHARGYQVSERQITDWVQKGLLPPRTAHGRGRGRGKVYVWPQPDIIEWTVMVETLLRDYARTKRIPLALWLFGFDVPSDRIRPLLLTYVRSMYRGIVGESQDMDDMADAVSRLAVDVARGDKSDMTPEIMEAWISFAAFPGYRMSRAARRDLLVSFASEAPDAGHADPEAAVRMATFIEGMAWLGEMFRQCSLPALLHILSVADDGLLQHAQQQWCRLLARLKVLATVLMSDVASPLDAYGRNGAVKFGAWFVVLYIQGQRLGYGDHLDKSLGRVLVWLDDTGIPWARAFRCDVS